jgi:hypothetical protein
MKKSLRKLALRKETVRALSNTALEHAIGGQDIVVALAADESRDRQCPAPAALLHVG